MQQYNFWQAIPQAFYSKNLYKDVDQNWRGIGLRYLLLICFICSLPLLHTLHNAAARTANDLYLIAAQAPIITIKDGTVSIDKPVPYEIKEPETNKTIIVIDTSAKQNDSTQNKKAFMLLSNDKLTINGKSSTKIYSLTDIKNSTIDQTRINHWVKILTIVLFVIFYLTGFLFYFIPSLLIVLFYGAIAKLFVRSFHSYAELTRLAAVALTPTLILIAALTLFSIALPYRNIIYLMLSLGYLTFAIEANRPHKKP